jgi:pentatricopeptide repeat protein
LYDEWKKEGKQFNRDYYLQLLDSCVSGIKEDPAKFSKKAVEIFEQFKKEYEPSMDEYNFLIQCYCLSNQLEKGFETWNLTKTLNLPSDQQTFFF